MRNLLNSNGVWIALILACLTTCARAQFDAMGRPVPALQRKLPSILLPRIKLDALADVFAKAARISVRIPWDTTDFNRETVFSTYLHDCTVDSAIYATLGYPARVIGDEIVVNAPEANGPIVRIQYPIADLARRVSPVPGDGEEQLVKLIEDFILPETWKDNGGADGEINCGPGFLVVDQTPGGQIKVQNALDVLGSAMKRDRQPDLADLVRVVNVLEVPVRAAKFSEMPLGKVIEQLAGQTGANILVNWTHLEDAGITETSPITVDLTGVPLGVALGALLRLSGEELNFAVIDGIILIDLKDRLHRSVEIRKYDIAPLLKALTARRRGADAAMTRQDAIDALTKALEDNVATEDWKDNGGAIGSMRVIGDIIVVQNSVEAHEKIARFLADFSDAWAEPGTGNTPKPLPKIPDVKIGTVELNGVSLKVAFAQLAAKSGSRVMVNWRYLAAAGIDNDLPVTLRVDNATLKRAVEAVFEAVRPSVKLSAVAIDDHVVEITTEDSLAHREPPTRFYPVQPLIDALLAHQGGALGRLNSPTDAAMELIRTTIESKVNPDNWRDNGGAIASFHSVNNVMIISAPALMLQQVEAILPRMKHEAEFGFVK